MLMNEKCFPHFIDASILFFNILTFFVTEYNILSNLFVIYFEIKLKSNKKHVSI